MSPSVPVPNPMRLRQFPGWYTPALNGRGRLTPSQPSQSSDAGTGSLPGGIATASPQDLSQKTWTSRILPMTHCWIIASVASCVSWEEI
jgi:hypothetical protein